MKMHEKNGSFSKKTLRRFFVFRQIVRKKTSGEVCKERKAYLERCVKNIVIGFKVWYDKYTIQRMRRDV